MFANLRPRAFIKTMIEDESGNLTAFSILMLLVILTLTGASVDVMRYESVRAEMQTTMDRAVLSAADLDQEQTPETVVKDYLTKVGLDAHLDSVVVDAGLNYRTVTAEGHVLLPTYFLRFAGIGELRVDITAAAEEKISHVEVSMVLDVSGSMNGNRLANMKNAADEFVDTVLQDDNGEDGQGLTTVSIVPYNANVALGQEANSYFTLVDDHGYSNCATFESTDFDDVSVSSYTTLEKIGHFDPYNAYSNNGYISTPWCDTDDRRAIMVHQDDADTLKGRIQHLYAQGNTAIDLGVKWGAALLDDAINPSVRAMSQNGLIRTDAADRPASHDDVEAIKFLVVMTDGENTTQFDLKERFKRGESEIWVDDRGTPGRGDDYYSVRVRGSDGSNNQLWYYPGAGQTQYYYYYGRRYSYTNYYFNSPRGNDAKRISWPEFFDRQPSYQLGSTYFRKPAEDGYLQWSDWNDYANPYEATVGGDSADDRLSRICTAAKNEGIVIFAIAFEAPERGKAALMDCASSPSHYFDVAGVEITETFHAIARQINSLRLIQ